MSTERLLKSSLISAAGTLVSRVLGLARELVMAAWFGAGEETAAFFNARTIPDMFRKFVADEGLTGAMIPELARAERDGGAERVREVARASLGLLIAVLAVLTAAMTLGAPQLVLLLDWDMARDPERYARVTELTRVLIPFMTMASLVSWAEGLLNHRGRFFAAKAAPGMVSVGMVLWVVAFSGWYAEPVHALAWGLVFGGVCEVAICVPPLVREFGPLLPQVRGAWADPGVRRIVSAMGQVALIGIAGQANTIVLRQLGNNLSESAFSQYNYAFRVTDLVQGLASVAVGSAVLPAMARAVHAADWTALREDLSRALRLTALAVFPACAVTSALASPTIALLFQRGRFDADTAAATAQALAVLVWFLVPASAVFLAKKVFFALDARPLLLWVGLAGVVVQAIVGWPLVSAFGLPGLSLALIAATGVQVVGYAWLLERRVPGVVDVRGLARPLGDMAAGAVLAGLVASAIASLGDWAVGFPFASAKGWINLTVFSAAGVTAVGVYVGWTRWRGLGEIEIILGALRRRLGR